MNDFAEFFGARRRGPRLARPAHTITLCEVYESIEGRLCLMGCVEGGEEFVITRNGTPVARLSPIAGRRILTES